MPRSQRGPLLLFCISEQGENTMLSNIPEVKLGIIAVSRGCSVRSPAEGRRAPAAPLGTGNTVCGRPKDRPCPTGDLRA